VHRKSGTKDHVVHVAVAAELAHVLGDSDRRHAVDRDVDLRSLTGQEVRWLAYPFGGFDPAVATIAQQCGVDLAFTTKPLPVWHRTPSLQIPRYCIYKWSRNSFAIRLDKWLSVG
jgi:peptidoglycan/xylan/chitin deacetylase (PgdA/CDA1 family)